MAENKTTAAPSASTTPSKGKSPLPILLIVGCIVLLLCGAISVVGFFVVKKGREKAQDTIDNSIDNEFNDIFEEGLEGDGDTDYELGGLPNDFPSDVPVYKNSEVLYGSSSETDGVKTITATLSVEDDEDDVIAFYEKELEDEGWDITEEASYQGYIVGEKGSREVSVYVLGDDTSSSIYIVIIE